MTEAGEQRQPPPFAGKIDRTDEMVMIYCGKRAWELARPAADRVASLVFPYYKKANTYAWPVAGKEVLVISDEHLFWSDELVYELFCAGATRVHIYGRQIPGELYTYDPAERRK